MLKSFLYILLVYAPCSKMYGFSCGRSRRRGTALERELGVLLEQFVVPN